MSEDKNRPGEKSESKTSPANNSVSGEKVQPHDENISPQAPAPNTGDQPGAAEPEMMHSPTIGDVKPGQETLQPQTDMEIPHHHHAHHAKTWKDYLYEFLMLFL